MKRVILPLIFGLLGCAVLTSLGVWQVQRLAWKEARLAEIEARIGNAPVALPVVPDAERDKYLAVMAEGRFLLGEVHVLISTKGRGAVYRVLSGFETVAGQRVIVDRGTIPTSQKARKRRLGAARIEGNLHWPQERDSFTPENDVAGNIWFARDIEALADHLGVQPVLVVVREMSQSDAGVTPLPVTSEGIPNDHLQYAVTWFGLAIVWALMTLYYLRHMRRGKKGQAT